MASSSWKSSKCNLYSAHSSPVAVSPRHNQTMNSVAEGLAIATSTVRSWEYLPYGRQRSVFPYGIVSECDLNNSRSGSVESNDKYYPGKPDTITTKWDSSPCLAQNPSSARWGSRLCHRQTSTKTPRSKDNDSSRVLESQRRPFRMRFHSCRSALENNSIGLEFPQLSSQIMVQAQPVRLVGRQSQPLTPAKPKLSRSTTIGKSRATSVSSVDQRKADTSTERQQEEVQLSGTLSDVKLKNAFIFIENGKAVHLKPHKINRKKKLENKEVTKSKTYREFQEAMQKFEDAHLSLEGEVNAKVKTFEQQNKEHEFFNEHIQTQLVDLFSSVKEKRRFKRGKNLKHRC